MKKILFYTLTLIILGSFSSCSTDSDDDLNPDKEIIGVWEQESYMDDSGYRLVFTPDHSGILIYRKVQDLDITSSAIMMYWERVDNTITISNDFDSDEPFTMTLIPSGQLVFDNQDALPFDKISDTTLDY